MKKFIVTQVHIKESVVDNHNRNVEIATFVRLVNAENEAEAIGKFILGTKDIEAQQKLEPIVWELASLKEIK